MSKFKVGDVILRIYNNATYPILGVKVSKYTIELPNGKSHDIDKQTVDRDCRKLTKLERALK